MSNKIKKMVRQRRRKAPRKGQRNPSINQMSPAPTGSQDKPVLVHGAMKYSCEKCGRSWWMFLEKGIEEKGEGHKPSPFVIRCKCGGSARDTSGIIELPEEEKRFGGYAELLDGESYFANRDDCEHGVPVLRWE